MCVWAHALAEERYKHDSSSKQDKQYTEQHWSQAFRLLHKQVAPPLARAPGEGPISKWSHLLDVDPSPGKQVHDLRVVPALMVAMPQGEVGVIPPGIHLSGICKEGKTEELSAGVWKQQFFPPWPSGDCKKKIRLESHDVA